MVATMISRRIGTSVFSDRTEFSVTTARFGVARSVLSVELLRTITLVVPKSEQHESALGLRSPECHNPFFTLREIRKAMSLHKVAAVCEVETYCAHV